MTESAEDLQTRAADARADVLASAGDPIDTALAVALEAAAKAGRFDVVAQLAREIEARRLSSAGVVRLDDERRSRR